MLLTVLWRKQRPPGLVQGCAHLSQTMMNVSLLAATQQIANLISYKVDSSAIISRVLTNKLWVSVRAAGSNIHEANKNAHTITYGSMLISFAPCFITHHSNFSILCLFHVRWSPCSNNCLADEIQLGTLNKPFWRQLANHKTALGGRQLVSFRELNGMLFNIHMTLTQHN